MQYIVSYRFKTVSIYQYKVKPYRYIVYRDIYRCIVDFLNG